MVCKFNKMKIHWVRNIVQDERSEADLFLKEKKYLFKVILLFLHCFAQCANLLAYQDQNKNLFNLILETIEIRNS